MSMNASDESLLESLLAGEHRALARTISKIENRETGYQSLVSALYSHTGNADVIGITGSPGAGKSTLVDKLAEAYRARDETVGIIAIDPSSPFTGGAVLGDRIRMASTVGDMDVFVRSMSARGALGGLSTATADAVKAMDAFGKDKIIIETVGAGQNEIDIVQTADTVAVLVPPGSGDDVQTLKAGILEIADVFIVNKADRDGADRTVQELREMVHLGEGKQTSRDTSGHHGVMSTSGSSTMDTNGQNNHSGTTVGAGMDGGGHAQTESKSKSADLATHQTDTSNITPEENNHETVSPWSKPIIETVATEGSGIETVIEEFAEHRTYLKHSGEKAEQARQRYAEEIRTLLRGDINQLIETRLNATSSVDVLAEAVRRGETDPYTIMNEIVNSVEPCLDKQAFEGVSDLTHYTDQIDSDSSDSNNI
ncbi:methylmalonyl Co-A mutase-associated GTPase MeaB [Haloquadratum walsbyi]|uniref:YgfD family GTPase n=1 Tax=Haloquadratum walsbyi (strain DSM 16854 / JCM 12705 / C23) TaxID=768065 RepID=G0LKU6_HALWC|nr:methylmalonyl Co-A mutase-associated GTPase MeaB [Haloquadratum walsbyi]CCC40386.1 YgfD family GTPase [Haloquadratum walsbyi C23]